MIPNLSLSYYALILIASVFPFEAQSQVSEILGRPTDHSVTLNVMFEDSAQFYCEYSRVGDSEKMYTDTVHTQWFNVGEIVMDNLEKDAEYTYRTAYRYKNSETYQVGDYHYFHTQRSKGSTFRFVVEADPHPYDKKCYHPLWEIALDNQLADHPDFMLDLGDTFGDDRHIDEISKEDIRQLYINNRLYFGRVCHSAPLFFCLGNHEGESGYYLLQNPPENLAVWETLWRKIYYPNPFPDGFYSGNTTEEDYGMGLPENYYSWHWGDALFIVLDAYRYYTASAKPRNWEWTIGKDQYDWLKETLESSNANFKFAFMHHIMGESRGGVELAKGFEWGGYEKDGTRWSFDTNRPGWEMPLHQLFVENNVTIFFQGHDHLFAQEELDGIIYQTVPMPSDSSYMLGVTANAYAFSGNIVPGSGHLRVEVSSERVKVDFVNVLLPRDESPELKNGDVAFSYSINRSGSISVLSDIPKRAENSSIKVFPNPFRDSVQITFSLKGEKKATIEIYNISGKRVAKFHAYNLHAGENIIHWDTKMNNGLYANPGVYFCTISTKNEIISESMIKVR
jgi:hypothetical protein